MTGFELAIVAIGVIAIYIIWAGVQSLCRTWARHSEDQALRQEKMLIELIAMNGRLLDIEESLRNLDRT